nr:metallophosphoesterase [Cryobacterium sp. MLB-32]
MKRARLARHDAELGFVPQDCVRWLAPGQLIRTAIRVVLAEIFADYGDKRELQEVFSAEPLRLKEQPHGDLWLDFVADLGDGFDSTASIATLLAADEVHVRHPVEPGLTADLPRGHLLVMGGDEVYPTASARAYEDRTLGPYASALPADAELPRGNRRPSLLALPGNHDWYDGLSAFLRIFTRPRKIGAWHTIQARSYFALRLGHGWWLVGLDSQLGEYIDEPQLNYFTEQLTKKLRPGDAIILCSASPTWVHTETKDPDAFNQLHYFEKHFLRNRFDEDNESLTPTGAHVRLWLSGDSHHYTRYEQVTVDDDGHEASLGSDPRCTQLITCGLGGAFLASTHRLPAQLTLPPPESRMSGKDRTGTHFRQAPTTYPDAATSLAQSARIANLFSRFWLGWRNPSFPPFLATAHLLLFLPLVWILGLTAQTGLVDLTREAPRFELLAVLAGAALFILLFSLVAAVSPWRWPPRSPVVAAVGFQITVLLLAVLVTFAIRWPAGWPTAAIVACAAGIAWVGAAVLGTELSPSSSSPSIAAPSLTGRCPARPSTTRRDFCACTCIGTATLRSSRWWSIGCAESGRSPAHPGRTSAPCPRFPWSRVYWNPPSVSPAKDSTCEHRHHHPLRPCDRGHFPHRTRRRPTVARARQHPLEKRTPTHARAGHARAWRRRAGRTLPAPLTAHARGRASRRRL